MLWEAAFWGLAHPKQSFAVMHPDHTATSCIAVTINYMKITVKYMVVTVKYMMVMVKCMIVVVKYVISV